MGSANIWNCEKAIMCAERAQIENDLNFIGHNLDNLILERQQFEDEADKFQILYVNICDVVRQNGFQIDIEYVPSISPSTLSLKQIDSVSNRRKQNSMKLKLYQATTSPAASLKSDFDEPVSPQIKIKKQSQSQLQIESQPNKNNKNNKSSLWKRVSAKNKFKKKDKEKEKEKLQKEAQEQEEEEEREQVQEIVDEDEADAYVPFDEPDEFNLLDEEYKKLAMKFVSENDNFISAQ